MADYAKPLPLVTELNRPHWEGAKRHEYLIQQCDECGYRWFPPRGSCSRCLSTSYTWAKSRGKGKLFSFVVYHQAWLPGFKEELPYNVAIIELEEGVRLINNVVGVPNDKLRVGMPVEVTFEEVAPDVAIPKFQAVGA